MDVILDDAAGKACDRAMSAQVAFAAPLRSMCVDELIDETRQLRARQIDRVVVRRQQIHLIGAPRLQEVLEESGISICCVGFAGGFTGTLGKSYQEALDDTRRAIDVARELNAGALVVLPGEQGLHTYRHAERTVREGLTYALDHATAMQIRMFVPTDTVLMTNGDCFRPRQRCPLDWIMGFQTREIRPMVIVRGSPDAWRLPAGWLECLVAGGRLRICHRCANYSQNSTIVAGVLQSFAGRMGGRSD